MVCKGALSFIQHVQHADRFSSPAPERHGDHVPGNEAGGLVDLAKMAGVLVDLGGNPGLSRLENRSGNTLVPGNGGATRNRFIADRVLEDELFSLMVCQQNRAGFSPHLFQRNVQCRFDQLVEVDRLKQRMADPFDRFELRLIVQPITRIIVEPMSHWVKKALTLWPYVWRGHTDSLAGNLSTVPIAPPISL